MLLKCYKIKMLLKCYKVIKMLLKRKKLRLQNRKEDLKKVIREIKLIYCFVQIMTCFSRCSVFLQTIFACMVN